MPYSGDVRLGDEYDLEIPGSAIASVRLWAASLPYSNQTRAALTQQVDLLYGDYLARKNSGQFTGNFDQYLASVDHWRWLALTRPDFFLEERLRRIPEISPEEREWLVRYSPTILASLQAQGISPYEFARQLTGQQALDWLSQVNPELAYQRWLGKFAPAFNDEGQRRLERAFERAYAGYRTGTPQPSFRQYLAQQDPGQLALAMGPANTFRSVGRTRWLTY
jgi:hypothetical protein